MPRTDALSHADELMSGLLARQIVLLSHIRALLIVIAGLGVIGAVVGAVAAQS
jgi:hypothetical protein